MAISTWTVDTGTTTVSGCTFTSSGTSTYSTKPFRIQPGPQLVFKKAAKLRSQTSPVKRIPVKDFWHGVEWEEHKSYMPRKSITGKIIIGSMHKRYKKVVMPGSTRRSGHVINTVLGRATSHTQYANTKELFQEKLKGKA